MCKRGSITSNAGEPGRPDIQRGSPVSVKETILSKVPGPEGIVHGSVLRLTE
jgi:hypothetical protein